MTRKLWIAKHNKKIIRRSIEQLITTDQDVEIEEASIFWEFKNIDNRTWNYYSNKGFL